MENSTFWKQLTLPVVAVSVLISISMVAGLLWYSASNDLIFHIWGKEFGARANTPNKNAIEGGKLEKLEGKIRIIEQRMSKLDDKFLSLQAGTDSSVKIKPINKTRTLDVGQQWDEQELSFSLLFTSASGFEDFAKFEIAIRTPESPPYRTKVYKGWHRSFAIGDREITVKILNTNIEDGTVTVSLSELDT